MKELSDAQKISARESKTNTEAISAAIAEFATLLKVAGFPKTIKMEHGGVLRMGVAMPVISWVVIEGDACDATHILRTDGLITDDNFIMSNVRFFTEEWSEVRTSA